MEINYNDYAGMIKSRALAWKFRAGMELEDLIQEGGLVFCKCVMKYDPNRKACFGTFLFNSLNIHFGNISNTQKYDTAYRKAEIDHERLMNQLKDTNINPERDIMLSNSFAVICKGKITKIKDRTGIDVRRLLSLVLNNPDKFVEQLKASNSSRVTKKAIQKYVTKVWGWNISRTWMAFAAIRKTLQEV